MKKEERKKIEEKAEIRRELKEIVNEKKDILKGLE